MVALYLQDLQDVSQEMIDELITIGFTFGYPYFIGRMEYEFQAQAVLTKYGWKLVPYQGGYWVGEHDTDDDMRAYN